MIFWASCEVHKPATVFLVGVERKVEPLLNDLIKDSTLNEINMRLQYVPIVMPKEMHSNYPERSKLRRKAGVYDCAPHLDYATFTRDTFQEQVNEYVDAIKACAPNLMEFGAKFEQVEEFRSILDDVKKRLIDMNCPED